MNQFTSKRLAFERWSPLARQVVRQSLSLQWNDVLEIYSYIRTIPIAEAIAMEARRVGSDTHITLMTDDLWFTSMRELPIRWLRAPSNVELAINRAITAYVYLGGPADARRMRDIPSEKFDANAMGNTRQDEPRNRRKVRHLDLPIGRVCPERAEAYGLNYRRWWKSYNAALRFDLRKIRKAGAEWSRRLAGQKRVRITSDAGTDLKFETKTDRPLVDDGIISRQDVRSGLIEASLPAGKVISSVMADSAEGEIRFTDPIFLMGRSVRGLYFRFKKGRLVEWNADENGALLRNQLQDSKLRAKSNGLGWFSVGVNPAADACMLDNSIVLNDIGIGLGPHPIIEPTKPKASVEFEATIGLADVQILD